MSTATVRAGATLLALLSLTLLPAAPTLALLADYPAPGLMVSVGTHRLHLDCGGRGQPSVILDAGMGGNSLDWVRVQPELAGLTRVCTYDRAGYGWSENGPLPRTSRRLTGELHELLTRVALPPPYVLVSHSFAGFVARLFAGTYPQETAGLVLVDASHERQFEAFRRDRLASDIRPSWLFMRSNRPRVPSNLPRRFLEIAQRLAGTSSAYIALQGEMQSFVRSARQVQQGPPLPDVPLVVLSRGKRVWPANAKGDRMERLWWQLQRDLTRQSSARRRARGESVHWIAERAGHYIHLEQPEMVVRAVRDIVTRWRDRQHAPPTP